MKHPADQIRKLVASAAFGADAEKSVARSKARAALVGLNTELLDTLAGQRNRLVEELRAESRRLSHSGERATKTDTGELVGSALMLLRHYQRVDALIAAVMLLRIEDGHLLSNEERQQLDGPVETFLDRWMREHSERRRAEREQRKTARRKAQRS